VTGIDGGVLASIEKVLQGKPEQETKLQSIFQSPLHYVNSIVISNLLNDYRKQRLMGKHNCSLLVFYCTKLVNVPIYADLMVG